MKGRVDLVDNLLFLGSIGKHAVPFDAPEDQGGTDKAPSPMQMLLISAGVCIGMDVATILRKSGHDLRSLSIEIQGDQRDKPPKVFERIKFHFILRGNISGSDVEDAIRVALARYSSTVITLKRSGADIETSYEIKE